MALMIRQIAPADTVTAHLAVESLTRVLSPATIAEVLEDCGVTEQRIRKLPAAVTLLFCVAMNLYTADCLGHVFQRLVSGLRWLWPQPEPSR